MHHSQIRGAQAELWADKHRDDVVNLWGTCCTWRTITPFAAQGATQTVTLTHQLPDLLPLRRTIESTSR